ncbi:MAG: DUF899 family protein [Solirubrobacteraceae bacterium]
MGITFPGESAEYRAARDLLLAREVALRREMEAVAEQRRALPPGGVIPEDYVFQGEGADGRAADIRLSKMFARGRDTLLIYSYMFPRHREDDRPGPTDGETAELALQDGPCPSCTSLLDQWDGAAPHATPLVNLVIAARAPLPHLLSFARERGWRHLKLVSCYANTYSGDYGGQNADGAPMPMLNVFHRDGVTIRHFWGSELMYAPADPGQDPRQLGTLEPIWNMLDITPEGRPTEWDEQLSYPCCEGR